MTSDSKDPFREAAEQAQIKRVVRDSVHETLASLGFTPNEPHDMQADMLYVRKARKGSDELIRLVRASAITVAITGIAYALIAGIKHFMR